MNYVTTRRAWALGSIISAALVLGSCSQANLRDRIAPAESQQFVQSLLDTLTSAPATTIMRHFTPRLAHQPGLMDSMRSVQRHFDAIGRVDSAVFLGGTIFVPTGSPTVRRELAFEVHGERSAAVFRILLIESGSLRQVDAFSIEPLRASLATIHGFWPNMGFVQALFLMAALGAVGFSLWVAVQVARTRIPWRWVWVLVALVGVGRLAINWTTGELSMHIWSVQLGASMLRNHLAGPWIVAFTFPIGAIVAFRRRSRALASVQAEAAGLQASDGPATA